MTRAVVVMMKPHHHHHQSKTNDWKKDLAKRRKAAEAERSRRLAPLRDGIKQTAALELSLLAEVTAKFVNHIQDLVDKSSIVDEANEDAQS